MKEIIVGPGDEIRDVFWKALQVYWKLKREEPVCFHHNDCRIIIFPDVSNSETEILTDNEAKEIMEKWEP